MIGSLKPAQYSGCVDPRHAIAQVRRLYRSVDGFHIPALDALTVTRSQGSPIYGELMPTATVRLLSALDLGHRDVFYDLGAGVGKVVLMAALTTPVARAVGVELSARRVELGGRVLAAARADRLAGAERAELIEDDILTCELADASVVYTCSTAFTPRFLARVVARLDAAPRLRSFVSLQPLEPDSLAAGRWREVAVHRLDASWHRATKVHVYRRRPGVRAGATALGKKDSR